jgi:4-methyl-5(b-hydroxyethyl)-thiazole monophosphate biosynthesis
MKKILLVLSHDVEDVEALGTRALLRRAGLDVITATFQRSLSITTAFGLKVEVDLHVEDIDIHSFDMLIIPGGKYVKETIDLHDKMQVLAKQFDALNKTIAAICAGPRFLGRAGLLDGKMYTAFPGSEIDMPHAKAYVKEKKAMKDETIITGRSAGSIYEFVYEIVSHLLSEEHAQNLFKQIEF